jgi:hypothetical protein
MKACLAPFKTIKREENIRAVKTKVNNDMRILTARMYRRNKISENLQKTDKYNQVILTGDLNRRIDKTDWKSQVVVSLLEEGLEVVNKQSLIIYTHIRRVCIP